MSNFLIGWVCYEFNKNRSHHSCFNTFDTFLRAFLFLTREYKSESRIGNTREARVAALYFLSFLHSNQSARR